MGFSMFRKKPVARFDVEAALRRRRGHPTPLEETQCRSAGLVLCLLPEAP
jgi:hypothetical protein